MDLTTVSDQDLLREVANRVGDPVSYVKVSADVYARPGEYIVETTVLAEDGPYVFWHTHGIGDPARMTGDEPCLQVGGSCHGGHQRLVR